jgi:hypothetical protein
MTQQDEDDLLRAMRSLNSITKEEKNVRLTRDVMSEAEAAKAEMELLYLTPEQHFSENWLNKLQE